jgi:hypothetical protein
VKKIFFITCLSLTQVVCAALPALPFSDQEKLDRELLQIVETLHKNIFDNKSVSAELLVTFSKHLLAPYTKEALQKIKELLNKGANPKSSTYKPDNSPLIKALQIAHGLSHVYWCIPHDFSRPRAYTSYEVDESLRDIIREFLNKGMDPNVTYKLEKRQEDPPIPLLEYVITFDIDLIEKLVELGVRCKQEDGRVCYILLSPGILYIPYDWIKSLSKARDFDVEYKDFYGQTLLQRVVSPLYPKPETRLSFVKALLELGASDACAIPQEERQVIRQARKLIKKERQEVDRNRDRIILAHERLSERRGKNVLNIITVITPFLKLSPDFPKTAQEKVNDRVFQDIRQYCTAYKQRKMIYENRIYESRMNEESMKAARLPWVHQPQFDFC